MADDEHLSIIRQGSDCWNTWRRLNPEIKPDLTGISLSGKQAGNLRLAHADLTFATMKKANLRSADVWQTVLNFADMSGSNVSRAFFGRAHMYCVNLSGADLSFARFMTTDLNSANFSNSKIVNTSFIDCDLNGADFSNAYIKGATFAAVDLSGVKGLETVRFLGPSTLGIDTVYKSGGYIPTAFLRGCGVPEDFVKQIPSLAYKSPLQDACYICHHPLDRVFCERLHNELQSRGLRCWLLPETNEQHAQQSTPFEEVSSHNDKLLLVCSKNSLESPSFIREMNYALYTEGTEKRRIIFCLTRDDHMTTEWSHMRKEDVLSRVVSDFRHWEKPESFERALGKVIAALKAPDEM